MILAINLINDWCYPLDHCLIATKKEKKSLRILIYRR